MAGISFETHNPATGEVLRRYTYLEVFEIESHIARSEVAFRNWKAQSLSDRVLKLRPLPAVWRQRKREIAEMITTEMGKPLKESLYEVDRCQSLIEYYIQRSEDLLSPQNIPDAIGYRSYVHPAPMGPLLGIMPFNFPAYQSLRFAFPAILAGNSVMIKPADNVLNSQVLVDAILREGGLDEDVLQSITVSRKDIGSVIADPRVRGVTITGGTDAGRAVAAQAGRALKKVVLELGGNDPYIVLADANLDVAAECCVRARFQNSGQSCLAAKRWIVDRQVLPEFRKRVLSKMESLKVGDPSQVTTSIGPIGRADLLKKLQDQVARAKQGGATVTYSSQDTLEGKMTTGYFHPLLLLENVKPKNTAFEEEIFGPVAVLIEAADQNEAVRLANSSPYGLGAALFSQDIERAEQIARDELDVGIVFINDFVKSSPMVPFGGTKDSGYGRELGHHGLWEFTNPKSIQIKCLI